MSKRCGIWGVSSSLLNALDWCKRTAGRYWRFAGTIGWSTTADRRHDQFEGRRSTNVSHLLQRDSCGERIELKEFVKVLSVGDRIRVLCDDGVLVAEKISQTQFKLIDSQKASELVH
jgi:hypothetical protein